MCICERVRKGLPLSAAVVCFVAAGCTAATPTGSTPEATASEAGPTARPTATFETEAQDVRGFGPVAFVKNGSLWIHDFETGASQPLVEGEALSEPRWSPSGRWLAFRMAGDGLATMDVRTEGAAPILVSEGQVGSFAWSPRTDDLAFVADGDLYLTSGGASAATLLVGGNDLSASIASQGEIRRLAWGPAGEMLAFDWLGRGEAGGPAYQGIWQIRLADGKLIQLFDSGMPDKGASTVAKWTAGGSALLFWQGPIPSASLLADGTPLYALAAAGGNPIEMGKDLNESVGQSAPTASVLVYDDFVVRFPETPQDSSDRVLVVLGGGRETWVNKRLAVVDPANGVARALTERDQAVLWPAVSPDASKIAFSAMPDMSSAEGESPEEMVMDRSIWVMYIASGQARKLTEGDTYRDERPLWSGDGDSILFVRLDALDHASLWLAELQEGRTAEVVDGIGPLANGLGYYGHVEWGDYFDWWRPPR